MKLFKYAVFAVLLSQTGFLNKNVQAFEVEGSRRVPIQVPRDVNLRDAQPVRVRIVAVEKANIGEIDIQFYKIFILERYFMKKNPIDLYIQPQ